MWKNQKNYNYIAKYQKKSWKTIKNEIERNAKINQKGKLIYWDRKVQKQILKDGFLEKNSRVEALI